MNMILCCSDHIHLEHWPFSDFKDHVLHFIASILQICFLLLITHSADIFFLQFILRLFWRKYLLISRIIYNRSQHIMSFNNDIQHIFKFLSVIISFNIREEYRSITTKNKVITSTRKISHLNII